MEGDAGASQLNPTDADGVTEDPEQTSDSDPISEEASDAVPASDEDSDPTSEPTSEPEDSAAVDDDAAPAPRSRLGRGWFVAVGAVLALTAAGVAVAGYLALQSHRANETTARNDAAALDAAKDCVAATHAPDASAMTASQMKIIDCATGAFGAQATLYSGVLVDAYQAANVKVQVSDMRAAIEKNNADGSIDVLVAVRTKMSNSETEGKEQGYRLRVNMVPVDGQYKVAKLDQVSS